MVWKGSGMKLEGKIVFVTGGAVRIGRAIVEALTERGARVVIHAHRNIEAARRVAGSLVSEGRMVWVVAGDLSSEAGCETAMTQAFEQAGGLDGLVNNAAVFHKYSLCETNEDRLLSEWRINLMAPFFLIRAFARRAASGRIVNLLDRRVATVEAGCAAYLLSKKGLAELTRIAALELAPAFTVNGVAPGSILPPPEGDPNRPYDRAGQNPLRRRVTPQAVAEAVAWLLEADDVTGQILYLDGGQHLLGTGGF